MGEFNVNKSDGSLEQTAGMPETYPADKVMMSDGVTSVEEKIGNVRMTKLWENPSPTNDFVAQSISLSSDDYDMLMVIFRAAKNKTRCCSEITLKGNGATLSIAEFNANGTSSNRTRYVTYSSDTSLFVDDGRVNGVVDNSQIIPYQIYGIKLT